MLKKLFFLILSFVCAAAYAQEDSLKKEILAATGSQTMLIRNARMLLLDKFIQKDMNDVRRLKNFLNNDIDNENYIGLYQIEDILLNYWTEDYMHILAGVNLLGDISLNVKLRPDNDYLFVKVRDESVKNYYGLQQSIQSAGLSAEDRDFLEIMLTYLVSGKFNFVIGRSITVEDDKLDSMGNEFLQKYPESKYTKFIKENIRSRYTKSDWALGFDFFSGYGITTGNALYNFKNHVPIGVGFDVYYKKLVLYLRDYIGFDRTLNDIEHNKVVWPKRSQVRIYLPEASLGYPVISNKLLRITPFAGIAGISFSPTMVDVQRDKSLETFEKFMTKAAAGINTEFLLNTSSGRFWGMAEDDEFFLRLRYGYNFSNSNKIPYASGNVHYITIGIGGVGRLNKRRK